MMNANINITRAEEIANELNTIGKSSINCADSIKHTKLKQSRARRLILAERRIFYEYQ